MQIRVGMSIGHSLHVEPHLPDMRKHKPTAEEEQEAKRKIEGSQMPDVAARKKLDPGALGH